MKSVESSSLTKKQKRCINRKNLLVKLAGDEKTFCDHHGYALSPQEILDHGCYNGNNGKRVCPHIRVIGEDGKLLEFKNYSSNNGRYADSNGR